MQTGRLVLKKMLECPVLQRELLSLPLPLASLLITTGGVLVEEVVCNPVSVPSGCYSSRLVLEIQRCRELRKPWGQVPWKAGSQPNQVALHFRRLFSQGDGH